MAVVHAPHLDLLGGALVDLLEREPHLDLQILAALGSAAAARATSATAEHATKGIVAKDVAKAREDVLEVREAAALEATAAALRAFKGLVPETVVLGALLRVAQHVVGLGGLLEELLGLLVSGILVGMVLDGHLLVGALDLVLGSVLGNSQHLVVVALCHHPAFFSDSVL